MSDITTKVIRVIQSCSNLEQLNVCHTWIGALYLTDEEYTIASNKISEVRASMTGSRNNNEDAL